MKTAYLVLLGLIAGSLALLSTGCKTTEGRHSNVSLLMPGTVVTPRVQSENDQGASNNKLQKQVLRRLIYCRTKQSIGSEWSEY